MPGIFCSLDCVRPFSEVRRGPERRLHRDTYDKDVALPVDSLANETMDRQVKGSTGNLFCAWFIFGDETSTARHLAYLSNVGSVQRRHLVDIRGTDSFCLCAPRIFDTWPCIGRLFSGQRVCADDFLDTAGLRHIRNIRLGLGGVVLTCFVLQVTRPNFSPYTAASTNYHHVRP